MSKDHEDKSALIADVLKSFFSKADPIFDLKRRYRVVPLKKRGDTVYEAQSQVAQLENEGHKVLLIAQNLLNETVLVTRLFYGDGMDEEDINLRVRVINKKGVVVPDLIAYLIYDPQNRYMQIADIRIEGDRVNRGYGSLVMQTILKLADEFGAKYITGWISRVDWDHIERSEHFYRKFGFDVELNHQIKQGTIKWVNKRI
nr:GNAT family N-acetyltransferase [Paenibacillus xylanexedens]